MLAMRSLTVVGLRLMLMLMLMLISMLTNGGQSWRGRQYDPDPRPLA
jgi:hypothetical protein